METKIRVMAWYACSQYESPDGGSGYEWTIDGEYSTREEAIAKAIETANTAMLDENGTKIEVFVYRAEEGLDDAGLIETEPREQFAYGKFYKNEQGGIVAADLQRA